MTRRTSIRPRSLRGPAVLALLLAGLAPAAASAATNNIFTVAGTAAGLAGDGGLATAAQLNTPSAVAQTPGGGYLIADSENSRIRSVSSLGLITTVAGTTTGFSGDGGSALAAQLDFPSGVAHIAGGGYLIADQGNNRIRRVAADGTITTVAGAGTAGYSGDGGPATSAELSSPTTVAVQPDGGYLIADTDNFAVRRVAPDGTITTVAGDGTAGSSGDGGPATSAKLDAPFSVAVQADGGYLIADGDNARIRQVAPDGTITSVAGNGNSGFSGDGGPAVAAELNFPTGVTVASDGSYLIADTDNQRVRRVSPSGTITTVAGTGGVGLSGDGQAASAAEINTPIGLAVTADGGLPDRRFREPPNPPRGCGPGSGVARTAGTAGTNGTHRTGWT